MDWPKLLKELDAEGFTQTQIGERCGVAQSTVSDISRAAIKSPSFQIGTNLIAMHAEVMAAKKSAVA